jgi:hypothetical protein
MTRPLPPNTNTPKDPDPTSAQNREAKTRLWTAATERYDRALAFLQAVHGTKPAELYLPRFTLPDLRMPFKTGECRS